MANLYQCDDGIKRELDNYSGFATHVDLVNCIAALFTSPTSVTHATTLGALTEATFPGYARITLSSAWPAATVTAHLASTQYPSTLLWTCTGGAGAQNIYGIYVLDPSATLLLYVATFDSPPYVMVNNGDQIAATLVIQGASIY